MAQGSVAISGFEAQGEAAKIVRGVPTVGRIANGAIIEREIEFALNRLPNVRLALRNADFTTAKRIAAAVNDYLGAKCAEPIDPSTVQLSIPPEFKGNVVAFLTEIEQLQVEPDLAAKIIIDERSGIIVMGRDVRVATVAVAQGNLTVTISERPGQPAQSAVPRPHRGDAAFQRLGFRRRQEARVGEGRRIVAATRRRPQWTWHRPARPDQHSASDQGRGRDRSRHRGDVMQASFASSIHSGTLAQAPMPTVHGRPDYDLADALTKVSPKAQAKAKAKAQDFEAVFLNSMFSQMTNGLKGEGPFGNTPGTGVWRSMLTEQYSKSFAKAGGVGISKDVFRELILQQAKTAGQTQGKQP